MLHLEQPKRGSFKEAIERKLISPEKLPSFCREIKNLGKTIATLNGSFDLLHPGHLEMIYQASLQADVFILLLNTDASIAQYKSKERPINPLEVRLQHVAALEMVNYVSWFDEVNPIEVLGKIAPNVHVNGSEYGLGCIEADTVVALGGKIHIVDLVGGYSTSTLIKKIQSLCV